MIDRGLHANPYHWIKLSVLLFGIAALAGMGASLIVSVPSLNSLLLTFREYRPLHTFFSLMAVVAGAIGMVRMITVGRLRAVSPSLLMKWAFRVFVLFVTAAAAFIAAGVSTGREYFSWMPVFTVLLLFVLLSVARTLWVHNRKLSAGSPEGFWLVGLGLSFVMAGLIESQFWLVPFVGNDIVRDLTVQWHGIDTFIAGLNALMYGVGIFIIQEEPRPLRKSWLFAIAAFSILFTFGHHHYVSPQPNYLKILAFLASMVAMVSFLRHFRSFKKMQLKKDEFPTARGVLLKSVEIWTLVSVGSGVLFAIPQVNLIIHGTYFVVIHAMGSMIGVNLLLVFFTAIHFADRLSDEAEKKMIRSVRGINYSLWALWIILGAAGLIKGVMRLDSTYWEFMEVMTPVLYLFPVVGLYLTIRIIQGGYLLFTASISTGRMFNDQYGKGEYFPPDKKELRKPEKAAVS